MSNPLLLIDENRAYVQALGEYLERMGFDVYTAVNSKEVLQMLETHMPKYIVGDPNIKDVDAVELFIKIKIQHPGMPLIVIADDHRMDHIMREIGLNAFNYIKKPVNSTELNLSLLRAKEWRMQQDKISLYSDQLETLHRATFLYHQLFDEIPCYLSVQNRQYRITDANRLFKQHFGDAVGEYCYKIYKHRDTPCRECPVAKTFEDGQSHATEEVVTSKDGKQYNVMTWTAPIRDDENNISHVIEMSTNITQIRELQNHLESLGMMIGSMSHGVKGMLTALDGGIYQIETGLKKNDHARIARAMNVTKDTSERIKKMVLNILYYAKSREVDLSEVDIQTFSETIVKTILPVAEKNHVALIYQIPENLGTFLIDAHWFQAAVINVIENSIDACASDAPGFDSKVEFSVFESDNRFIVFEVKDNGNGMSREVKDKIFTLFFSSKGSKGTGLGLFISNHVVKAHGGSIVVESEPMKGSVFTIQVPRIQAEMKGNQEIYIMEQH